MQEIVRDPKSHPHYLVSKGCLWFKAQGRMKEQAHRGRCEMEFQVRDMMYLKAQPYKLW